MTTTEDSVIWYRAAFGVQRFGVRIPIFRLIMAFFAAMVIFSSGCAGPYFHEKEDYRAITPITIRETTFDTTASINSGRITLFLSEKLSVSEKWTLISSIRKQSDAFEKDFGLKTRKVDVYSFDTYLIPCGILKGRFTGCHYGSYGPIHLARDKMLTGTAMYHELIHHNIKTKAHKDPKMGQSHNDPRWKSKWNPRWKNLVKEIELSNIIKSLSGGSIR